MSINLENEVELTDEQASQLQDLFKLEDSPMKESDIVLLYPPIEFSDEELQVLCNTEQWTKGYKTGAELAGFYTVLVNSGMDAIAASNIIANEHAMKVNIETQKIINDGLKIQGASIKKTQL